MKNGFIPDASFPEEAGVNSYELEALFRDIDISGMEFHSLMVMRNGMTAFESHSLPYGRDRRRNMFSVSRTLVAVAAGFAEHEGFLSLESKVIDFFPDFRPPRRDKFLGKLTVRHLLSMNSGKAAAPVSARSAETRLKNFFSAKWNGEPGKTPGCYVEDICIVCDILNQATGETITEYLTPRLYKPLGFAAPPLWEKDNTGIEGGYWGLYLSPEELAKISICLMNGGVYNGKQIIPRGFVEDMLSLQTEGVPYLNGHGRTDYGLGIRLGKIRNSYIIEGTFSQLAFIFKDFNAVIIACGTNPATDASVNCIFRHIPRLFTDCSEKGPRENFNVSLSDFPVISAPHQEKEKEIKGKLIQFRNNALLNALGYPYSILPLSSIYMDDRKGGNINNIVLDFEKGGCIFAWDEGTDHNMIRCSMNGELKYDSIRISGIDYTVTCAAAWRDENSLEIRVRPLEAISERRITLEFEDNGNVTMTSDSGSPLENIFNEVEVIANDYLRNSSVGAVSSLISNFSFIASSPIRGKIN